MSIPQHKNPSREERKARAPYNFVPLPEEIRTIAPPPSQAIYHANLLTGKFTCTLTTASPLYVRAARSLDEYKNGETPSDPFYGGAKETLLIPGSSLRGMLRTMVEVVSFSKWQFVTNKHLFFRTVEKSSIDSAYGARMTTGDPRDQGWYPNVQAGYVELRGGEYYIRPARSIHGTTFFRVEEDIALKAIGRLKKMARQGDDGRWRPNPTYQWFRMPIWFRPTAPTSHLPESPQYYAEVKDVHVGDRPDGSGWERSWFIASGWVPSPRGGRGKHLHWIVAPPAKDDSRLIQINDDDIDLYKEYGGGISQAIKRQNMSVLPQKSGEQVPCFYIVWIDEEGRQRVAFGHTAMFRLPYTKSPKYMLPSVVRSVSDPDLAETLFGKVEDTKSGQPIIAGRVFVTEAELVGDMKNALMESVAISTQALSSPKPTSFQHYLTQTNPDNPSALSHYDDQESKTTLRGHKFYWHLGGTEAVKQRLSQAMKPRRKEDGTEDPEDRNEFQPVKEGQTFVFYIYFENLRPEELGALLWVLDKAFDDKYRLKIGMGKPYGLGSVAISYKPYLTDRQERYGRLFDDDSWNDGWMLPEETQNRLGEARDAFAHWLLKDNTATPDEIDNLPRIQEFLTLLAWKGPDPSETTYMHLDEFSGKHSPNNPNRLTKRPVLPYPTKVFQGWFQGASSTSAPPSATQPTTKLAQKRQRPPKPEVVANPPSKLKTGDVIRAIVYDAPAKGNISLTPVVKDTEDDICFLPEEERGLHRFKEGKTALVEVIKVEQEPEGSWVLQVRPIRP